MATLTALGCACGEDEGPAPGTRMERLERELTKDLRACKLLAEGTVRGLSPVSIPEELPGNYAACVQSCAATLGDDCEALSTLVCEREDPEEIQRCLTECAYVRNPCGEGDKDFVLNQLCDGFADCPDRSDERHCLRLTGDCDSGQQLTGSWQICDGEPQCDDGSDEANCPEPVTCADGTPLNPWNWCDGWVDCEDESDEAVCDQPLAGMFRCQNGQHVPEGLVCDLKLDCLDGSDESAAQGCAKLMCDAPRFACGDGHYIAADEVCDGARDCSDGRDENSSFCADSVRCESGERAPGGLCDGTRDCADGSDEQGCEQGGDGDGDGEGELRFFLCDDGEVIRESLMCDGNPDCAGGEDEQRC